MHGNKTPCETSMHGHKIGSIHTLKHYAESKSSKHQVWTFLFFEMMPRIWRRQGITLYS